MRLIDADALKAEWKMGDFCEECKRDVRQCAIDYCFTRMDVCGMIDDAPTVNGWISVKDRLPDKNGKYLCVWQGRSIDTGMFTNGHFRLYGEVKDKLVSHWMPLPSMEGLDET